MSLPRDLEMACTAVGLGCRCELSHSEPRYKLEVVPFQDGENLSLVIRDDGSIVFKVLDHSPSLPGLLLEICEETVCREPVMDLWLPSQARHQHLVHRQGDCWVHSAMPNFIRVGTVAEAMVVLRNRG